MGIPVLVFGKSGVGKSYSLRNFETQELGVIRVLKKPLPFKSKFKPLDSDDYKKDYECIVWCKDSITCYR